MTIERAAEMFREFHAKEPNEVVPLDISIPRYFYPVGYAVQISYISNKWNEDADWRPYIHWWENPTLVCVPFRKLDDIREEFDIGFFTRQKFDIGPNRGEVTFLGYAIDFNVSADDRTNIKVYGRDMMGMNTPEELKKLRGSYTFKFDDNPKTSEDYIVCSPNGKIVYAICADTEDVFAFINNRCRVTPHGIEG